ESLVRLPKLHAIKQVEYLAAELEREPLPNLRIFEHGEVPIRGAMAPQFRIRSRFVAERKWRWRSKTGGVEPLVYARLRRARQRLAAICDYIGALIAAERVGGIVRGKEGQRCSGRQSGDPVNSPTRDHHVDGPRQPVQEAAAFAHRQVINVADDEIVWRIET